jgi:hypothetical protein
MLPFRLRLLARRDFSLRPSKTQALFALSSGINHVPKSVPVDCTCCTICQFIEVWQGRFERPGDRSNASRRRRYILVAVKLVAGFVHRHSMLIFTNCHPSQLFVDSLGSASRSFGLLHRRVGTVDHLLDLFKLH